MKKLKKFKVHINSYHINISFKKKHEVIEEFMINNGNYVWMKLTTTFDHNEVIYNDLQKYSFHGR